MCFPYTTIVLAPSIMRYALYIWGGTPYLKWQICSYSPFWASRKASGLGTPPILPCVISSSSAMGLKFGVFISLPTHVLANTQKQILTKCTHNLRASICDSLLHGVAFIMINFTLRWQLADADETCIQLVLMLITGKTWWWVPPIWAQCQKKWCQSLRSLVCIYGYNVVSAVWIGHGSLQLDSYSNAKISFNAEQWAAVFAFRLHATALR